MLNIARATQMMPTKAAPTGPETAPASQEQLKDYIRRHLGLTIADRPVCEEHDAPMGFMWDAISDAYPLMGAVGPRGGGKTKDMSIIEFLKANHRPRYGIAHVGGTQRQADLCYSYTKQYHALHPWFSGNLRGVPLMSRTEWRNGSELFILPATEGAVSGPHPNMAVGDEFDFVSWLVYQTFVGMGHATDEYIAQDIYISALRTSYGTMRRIMDEAHETGLKPYRWCILDVMERCATCLDAERVKRQVKTATPDCDLWPDCKGRVRKATGHLKLYQVIKQFRQMDRETWDTQMLANPQTSAGLVYPQYSDILNVSEEAEYKPDLPVYWGGDWGWEAPTVILLAQRVGEETHIFDELGVTHHEEDETLDRLCQLDAVDGPTWFLMPPGETPRGPYKKPTRAAVDASAIQLANRMRARGIKVFTDYPKVMEGISIVRRRLCDNRGTRWIKIHPRCRGMRKEVQFLHRKEIRPGIYGEEPADNTAESNPDHYWDGVRYLECMFAGRRRPGIEAV